MANWLFQPFSFIFLPRNCTSWFLAGLKILPESFGMYSVKIYRPAIDPATPINITAQMFSLKTICSNTITVNAGGRGKGTISTAIAQTNTNTYCHHIVQFPLLFNHHEIGRASCRERV